MAANVSVTRDIAAPPAKVWALLSDLPRMGEWSPENTGGKWVGGATGPAVGARFVGSNRNGKRSWTTTCKVSDCEPAKAFAFDVVVGPLKIARWEYHIEPSADGGSTVTETWTDCRGWLATKLGGPASGVADRASHNRAGMEETLRRLADARDHLTSIEPAMSELRALIMRTAEHIADYRDEVADLPVFPQVDVDAVRAALGGSLQNESMPAAKVLDELVRVVTPALVGNTGPRYFGFVNGGASDAATAADLLTTGWDQHTLRAVTSPAAAVAEEVAGDWLKDLLGLPTTASIGFVTGAQAANTVGLAAARHHLLADAGWDVERDGLMGAPSIRVVASVERHATIDRSLRLLGLGAAIVEAVPADANGAIDVDGLSAALAEGPPQPMIVCLQLGNVNTGACDDLRTAIAAARRHNAWVHVDGAFGLWANASPALRHLVAGVEDADSWACDGHKWLNVPYDCGYAFCAHRPRTWHR